MRWASERSCPHPQRAAGGGGGLRRSQMRPHSWERSARTSGRALAVSRLFVSRRLCPRALTPTFQTPRENKNPPRAPPSPAPRLPQSLHPPSPRTFRGPSASARTAPRSGLPGGRPPPNPQDRGPPQGAAPHCTPGTLRRPSPRPGTLERVLSGGAARPVPTCWATSPSGPSAPREPPLCRRPAPLWAPRRGLRPPSSLGSAGS